MAVGCASRPVGPVDVLAAYTEALRDGRLVDAWRMLLALPIVGDPVDSCIEWMVARLTGDYSQEWPAYFSDEATFRQRLVALWSMWQGAPERSTERLTFRLWAVARMQSLLNGMA